MKRFIIFLAVGMALISCGLGTRMPKREPVSAVSSSLDRAEYVCYGSTMNILTLKVAMNRDARRAAKYQLRQAMDIGLSWREGVSYPMRA